MVNIVPDKTLSDPWVGGLRVTLVRWRDRD